MWRSSSTCRISPPHPLTARACATSSGSSSFASRCDGSRRRSAQPTRRRRPRASSERSRRECSQGSLADVSALPQAEVSIAVRMPETPEGALFGDNQQWRFGAYCDDGGQLVVGGLRPSREPGRGRRRRVRRSPTTPSRWARFPTCSPTTPRWLPTCSSRPAAPTRSASCARSAAWPPTSSMRPGATRAWCRRSPPGSARRSAAAG